METPTGYLVAASFSDPQWAVCHEDVQELIKQAPKGCCVFIPPAMVFYRAADGYWPAHEMARYLMRSGVPSVLTVLHGRLPASLSSHHAAAVQALGIDLQNAVALQRK